MGKTPFFPVKIMFQFAISIDECNGFCFQECDTNRIWNRKSHVKTPVFYRSQLKMDITQY